jgi:hypothetical protein
MNAKINAVGLTDRELARSWQEELAMLETETERLAAQAVASAAERGGF